MARLLNTGSEQLELVDLTYNFVLARLYCVEGPFRDVN